MSNKIALFRALHRSHCALHRRRIFRATPRTSKPAHQQEPQTSPVDKSLECRCRFPQSQQPCCLLCRTPRPAPSPLPPAWKEYSEGRLLLTVRWEGAGHTREREISPDASVSSGLKARSPDTSFLSPPGRTCTVGSGWLNKRPPPNHQGNYQLTMV